MTAHRGVSETRWRAWAVRGPFAIAAAALQGGMNYAIILYLSFAQDLAATGAYRTVFSYYGLLSLASMYESNKVYIRDVVRGDVDGLTAIVANRLIFSLGSFLAIVLAWGIGRASGHFAVPDILLPIAAISVCVYPFDLYLARLQAERRFAYLFMIESLKYGGALLLFCLLIAIGWSVGLAVVAQLGLLALCNLWFFALHCARDVQFGAMLVRPFALLNATAARDARTYSIANMLPASLEHVDKLLVGAVFGLQWLGIYALAYSTGRFVYNIIKPALYVYYRHFVDAMPGWRLLRRVALGATYLGALMAGVFLLLVAQWPVMVHFAMGRWVTVILFLGYGLGMLHALYAQAFALNRQSVAGHAFKAHLLATTASLILLGGALASPPATALVLLALQYPLRDGLSVLLMAYYRGIRV
ncbi:hypothetical protein [Aquisediminimonas sediminicola]|uniref:hypothetical protein n=1 Tax=Alteraquisediminimonas sediminicola TaxID=2676787 RepID=UPI001C8E2A58|nr:hypothetical protein [Aquisediminimonas sediminicola]